MPQLWLNDTLDLLAAPYFAEVGTEFGDWQAITTSVDSLFLDGSVVSGESTGNRTVQLKVRVSASVRWALIEACEALFVEANKAASTLRFVPDEGADEVYDLFRAQPERTDDQSEAWLRRSYTFSFPALPFVRTGKRVTPAALAPGVTVEGFEGPRTGVYLTAPTAATGGGDAIAMPTAGVDATPIALFNVNPAATAPTVQFMPVSNCTGNGFPLTVTAAGDAEAVTAQSWALPAQGADYVTAGANIGGGSSAIVGVEWLDAVSASLGVAWGLPRANASGGEFAPWVVAQRPTGAERVRMRVRLIDSPAGDWDVYQGGLSGAAEAQVVFSGADHHDGLGSLLASLTTSADTQPAGVGAGYLRASLGVPVDISSKQWLSLWMKPYSRDVVFDFPAGDAANDVLSLRLFDASGQWSRYRARDAVGGVDFDGQWHRFGWDLVEGVAGKSPDGPANLASVVAYDVEMRNLAPWYIDSITAGPTPSPTSSAYGTMFDLDILGAARSPVQVALTGATAMSDWLVAAADTTAPPMLAVTSSKAIAAAPAAYDGQYRIIGALAPASAEASPTCVVAQMIDGVQVASTTLEGTVQPGNHYVDFGPCPLPLTGVPADNTGVSYTFTLTPADTDWADVLILDLDRPCAWLPNIADPMVYGWIDEPEPTAQMGRVWVGTAADRSDARSPADPPDLSLPFSVRAPGVQLLVYSTAGAPDVMLSYDPRRLC